MPAHDASSSPTGDVACSFCKQSYKDCGPLVEAPDNAAYICRTCAIKTLDVIESRKYGLRDTIVGIGIYLAMLVLGGLVIRHGFVKDGADSFLAWVGIGIVLLLGCLPMYGVVFRVWYPFGRRVEV